MGRKLFVGNLSFNTDERRLEEVFQAIGPVDSVNIVRDQMTGRARGFAFVEMQTEEGAKNAIDRLNETELDLLGSLMPRRQLLLKRADVAKVLNLSADARSYWLYTNTPIDNERVTAVFREYGFEAGLDRLAASA